jgi:hypothetical protein
MLSEPLAWLGHETWTDIINFPYQYVNFMSVGKISKDSNFQFLLYRCGYLISLFKPGYNSDCSFSGVDAVGFFTPTGCQLW